jgi:hypothetical protein
MHLSEALSLESAYFMPEKLVVFASSWKTKFIHSVLESCFGGIHGNEKQEEDGHHDTSAIGMIETKFSEC